jgi:choline kinase
VLSISALQVRGYKGDEFEKRRDSLGEGVQLVSNPDFASTEVLQSFMLSEPKWGESFYVAYSDIVFADSVMADLRVAQGDVCVTVDLDFRKVYQGRQGHPFSQCEAVSLYERGWAKGTIDQLGKQKHTTIDDAWGEMIGLFKFSARWVRGTIGRGGGGHVLLHVDVFAAGHDVNDSPPGCSGRIALQKAIADLSGSGRDVLTPDHVLDKLYLSDLLQRVVDDGMVKVVPVPIYGNWREVCTHAACHLCEPARGLIASACLQVDTPHDLQRANNAMMYLGNQKGRQELVQQMGRAFLSEANDLKRPVSIMARELDVDVGKIAAFTVGKVCLPPPPPTHSAAGTTTRSSTSTRPTGLDSTVTRPDGRWKWTPPMT